MFYYAKLKEKTKNVDTAILTYKKILDIDDAYPNVKENLNKLMKDSEQSLNK